MRIHFRGEVCGGWHGTHTIHCHTHTHAHTLSDMDILVIVLALTIPHAHTHTRLVLCVQRLVVLSLQPAPPQLQPVAPKEGKRIKWSSTSQFRLQSQRRSRERGGTMAFHVSKRRRDAMFPGSEKRTRPKRGNKWQPQESPRSSTKAT